MVLQVTGLDADAYGANHLWCAIVANDYHGLEWIAGLCYKGFACDQGEHGQIGTYWHIKKGSPIRDFNRYSGGVWTAEGENFLVYPFPLMSKGESDLVWWLPSSPKGEVFDIMIHVLSFMATHSEV